jgi:hypothetical protein
MKITHLSAALLICVSFSMEAAQGQGGRLNNLKVLSSRVDDVTTTDNILKSFVKPGMSDADRAKAIWTAGVKYRYQTSPPNEYLSADWEAHDPVKIFNVYGYCMCCCTSSIIESLNRLDGREARGRILNGHSVPEVKYGVAWHMFDCSLINYFPKPDGEVASVDEISAAVKEWYEKNPAYKGSPEKLMQLMRSDNWSGWQKSGPELLAKNPFYFAGYWPAKTHGWDATMVEYNRNSEVYDYGYTVGHKALFSLRPGESLVREAGNHGLHVNMESDPKWDGLTAKAPNNDLVYLKQFMPGYNGGVVGNGYHRYAPDLAKGDLEKGAIVYKNLVSTPGLKPAITVAQMTHGGGGSAVIEMSSPYVYLGSRLRIGGVRQKGDKVLVSISTNNGRTFRPLWSAETVGAFDTTVDLNKIVTRRYSYLVQIEIVLSPSSSLRGTGLNTLRIENDIQHAPRTLPWLGKGSNTITVAADGDTTTASRAFTCRITPDSSFVKNETSNTLGLIFENLKVDDGSCWWTGGTGSMTVPIETPGDITAIRYGAQFRARGEKDVIKALLSFDGGKSWTEAAKLSGPTPGSTQFFKFTAVPAGTRKALLKYEMAGNNTVGIFNFRADADYKDPLAAKALRPFTITHRWKEGETEKTKQVTVDRLPFTYDIPASADPEMVSVSYEMGVK